MQLNSYKPHGEGFILAVLSLALSGQAWAEDNSTSTHGSEVIEELVVHAHPLADGGLAQSIAVLTEEDIARASGVSIGEVVSDTLGVQSASFGPMVGQPVINGISGARVLVVENDQATMDMSSTPDHGITVEPFLADQIEVLKGSSTLLYGSGAIGGVIDVHTNRVPTRVPDKAVTGRGLIRGNEASNGLYGGLRLDGGAGNFAWHADAYAADHRDISIPGYASVGPFAEGEHEHEEEEGHEHEEEHEEEMPIKGRLENSYAEYRGGSLGAALVFERGHAGVSVTSRDWQYGIVGAHHHEEAHEGEDEHGHEEEGEHEEEGLPWIELEQTRMQANFGLHDPLPGFHALEGGLVVSEYEHFEIEGEGEIGSYYANDSWEGRVILDSEATDDWNPAYGLQFGVSELAIGSSEASAEMAESQHFAVFAVAQRTFESVEVETGARIESTEIKGGDGVTRDFLATSASLGAIFFPHDAWQVRLLSDFSTRAPRGDELFAENPHLATQGFEVGNVDLDEEEAFNLSFGVDYEQGPFSFSANLYRYAFDNYIYQRETGELVETLGVIEWAQTEATFTGGDIGMRYKIAQDSSNVSGILSFGFDMVRTDLDDSYENYLPRTPANRAMLAGEISWNKLWARLSYTHVFDQDDIASYETATSSYDNVDLQVDYRIDIGGLNDLTLFLAGRNLTDEEQRNHVSLVKDEAPLPGRRVEAGVRFRF